MNKLIAGSVLAVFVVTLWFAVMWCLWSLWGWVLPQVYPSGAVGLVAPGFWLFAACWTLVSLAGKAIFGRSKS